jgi:predicted phage terminase large subunit-like protein
MTQPDPSAAGTSAPHPAAMIRAELAKRELARRSLVQFTRATHPSYQAGWVHDDICRRLERFSKAVAAKQSPRLMLLMPPRHGKSELASIRFPAWHLGHYPRHEIINVGYNMDLPVIFSRKVREVVREPAYQAIFQDTRLDEESKAVEAWRTTQGGGFMAAGVGGGITGKGAHILIVDDPLKNQEEADNADRRQLLEDWFESTAYTRLAPGGGILFIETWWNDDDLAGRLQAKMRTMPGADQYEVVKYPALAEAFEYRLWPSMEIVRSAEALPEPEILDQATTPRDEIMRVDLLRSPGEALHPDRYDVDALARYKANLQPRVWSALYQQNPVPDEGMYFQKDYFRELPALPDARGMRVYTAWDFAIGEKQTNDWNVGATVLQDHNDVMYVAEVIRFKGDAYRIVEEILDAAARWSTIPGADYRLGLEDGQIIRALAPLLQRRMAERRQYPAYETLKPFTDKLARARPLQGRMQQGRVMFPSEASWYQQARTEMLRFPAGAHDDVVDALAWAVRLSMNHQPPQAAPEARLPSWKDKIPGLLLGGDGSHMAA